MPWPKGKKQTPQHVEKAHAPLRGRKPSPKALANMQGSNKGKVHTTESRANMREAHLRAEIGYTAAHVRLMRMRGSASKLSCVQCGAQAGNWAFNHDTPKAFVRVDPRGRPYSMRIQDYDPMCLSCHQRYDGVGSKRRAHRREYVS